MHLGPSLDDYLSRFSGVARLYGQQNLMRLRQAHMLVVGMGGVGSWVAEALCRSGVGALTLIEPDEVCVTNTNRQLHALDSTVGQAKLDVMAQRLRDIHPKVKLSLVQDFLTLENIQTHIRSEHDVVIDACDAAHVKAGLAAYCSALKVRLIMVGSSGGKRDPTQVQASDLGATESDKMLAKVRTQLYRHYGFARRKQGQKFRIDAIYSTEQMVYPKPDGSVCQEKQAMQDGVRLDCTSGFGSSVMVTGTFGFVAAETAIKRFLVKA